MLYKTLWINFSCCLLIWKATVRINLLKIVDYEFLTFSDAYILTLKSSKPLRRAPDFLSGLVPTHLPGVQSHICPSIQPQFQQTGARANSQTFFLSCYTLNQGQPSLAYQSSNQLTFSSWAFSNYLISKFFQILCITLNFFLQ